MGSLKGKASLQLESMYWNFNSVALRKVKIVYNFGLSECNIIGLKHVQTFSLTSVEKSS